MPSPVVIIAITITITMKITITITITKTIRKTFKQKARELTDLLVGERADYLERRATEIGATVEVNTFSCQLGCFKVNLTNMIEMQNCR